MYIIGEKVKVYDKINEIEREYIVINKQKLKDDDLDDAIDFKYAWNDEEEIKKDPYYYYLDPIHKNEVSDEVFNEEHVCLTNIIYK